MKRFIIDTVRRTENVGPRGTFPIQVLERVGGAWYMDREYVQHPHVKSACSFLLPERHIWVIFFRAHSGRHIFETYIHACQVRPEGDLLRVDDLYADVIRYWDGRWSVVDLDEMAAAVEDGHLSYAQISVGLRGIENGIRLLREAPAGGLEDRIRALLLAGKL